MRPLLTLVVRRDRVLLPVWVLATAVAVAATAATVEAQFSGDGARTEVLGLALATPSLLALRGVPNGASEGSFVFFQLFTWVAVVVGLMNTVLAARHGRADEERGRRELVASTPVRRTAPLLTLLGVGLVANLAVGLLSALGLTVGGLPAGGAAVFGAALTVTGLVFLGLGVLVGELVPTARAANGVGAALVLGAYAVRAGADATGTPDLATLTLTPSWPSWLSPIGWGEQTLALTANRLWPLLIGLVVVATTAAAAVAVNARRDLGASLFAERRGPATGGRSLRSHLGLDVRLQRTATLGWAAGTFLLALVIGSLATAVTDAAADNPQIATVLARLAESGSPDITALLVSAVMLMVGFIAAAGGVQAVLRLRQEETDGRAEMVLTTGVSRRRWVLDALVVGVGTTVVALVVAAVAAWAGFALAGEAEAGRQAAGEALLQLPAALVFVLLAGLLVVVVPRAAVAAGWVVLTLGVVLALLGDVLGLPEWLQAVDPFHHVPAVPVGTWTATIVLAAVGAALVAVVAALAPRRQLSA